MRLKIRRRRLPRGDNATRAAIALGPTTAVAGLALALHAQYGAPAAVVEGVLAAACGGAALKFEDPAIWAGAGACLVGATITWFGVDMLSVYTWMGASTVAMVSRLRYEHKMKHRFSGNLDAQLKLTQLQNGQARLELQRAKLMGGMPIPETVRGTVQAIEASSDSTEENALVRAIFAVYGQRLLGVHVETTEFGWRGSIALPPALDREKVSREWKKVSGALGRSGKYTVGLGAANNELNLKYVDRDPLEGDLPYTVETMGGVDEPMYLGPDEDGEKTLVSLLGKHVLILGTSGNGKSNMVQLMILRLVEAGAVVFGIDMKHGVEFESVKPLLETVADNPTSARTVLDWLLAEGARRADVMKREQVRSWSEDLGPFIWCFCDEMAELTAKIHKIDGLPTLAELLESCVRTFRAFGIHIVGSTQAPSKNVFGGNTDARTNYKIRISTRLEEAAHASFGFGPSWKSSGWDPNTILRGPGEFLLSSEQHRIPIRRKAQFVSDVDLAEEVARLAPLKARLEVSPWGGGGVRLSPSQRVRKFLGQRDCVTRAEIEEATGLNRKQVLNAFGKMQDEIERDEQQHTYRLRSPELSRGVLDGSVPE